MNYYYSPTGGDALGPVTVAELTQMYSSGTLTDAAQVCQEGTETWQPISELGLAPRRAPVAPPVRSAATATAKPPPSAKSLPLAIGLNFLLPGVGYLYMGRIIAGIGCMFLVAMFVFVGVSEGNLLPVMMWPGLTVVMAIDMIILANKQKKQIEVATTRQCPECSETIQAQARVCRFCKAKL